MSKQGFLKEVGEHRGLKNESLVLQQKSGYSAVYKIWQELKFYLDVFSNQATVSMKSVTEVYEVWCFLSLRKILVEALGFTEVESHKAKLKLNDFFELKLNDGLSGAGAFCFSRADGAKARLAHEPVFKKNGVAIRSYLATQKPDILLEVTFPNGKKCIWLFDTKYRIKTKNDQFDNDDVDKIDFVPDDALNQMHRYRDALIHISDTDGVESKSRPVFGAFALYPGFFDQKKQQNPYRDAIDEIGIGAFSLLPGGNNDDNQYWLTQFLREQIGGVSAAYLPATISEGLYVNEAARIPYHGMKQVLHNDLVLTARLGDNRHDDYSQRFVKGEAKWYHIPTAVFNEKFGHHIAQEICYLAIAQLKQKSLEFSLVYRVLSVKSVDRSTMSFEQTGVVHSEVNLASYWLFELGEPLTLNGKITGLNVSGFRQSLKLTTLSSIHQTKNFDQLAQVYSELIK